MKPQRPQKKLHTCSTNLEAYYIKNAIQRLAPIAVMINRSDRKFHLSVDDCNFKAANIILLNNIQNLKRNSQYNKSDNSQSSQKTLPNRNIISALFGYLGSQKNTLSRGVAS
ncbi:hypothetical protein [Wenyingzhuangia sp. 2_MG-2023]|uniref:hypothetical protein n=1 Tax=Wenyingzhuangia sp. 2_MG-2023 TaxID=3062639 RepID=UPI0026E44CC6|nr:hypothetical protein [Wenyingzhuangia sp. 2_MG-2023]MDO6738000.1 hypothetical protein [Wenyingzhuangia sp. 2_MG-2023]